MMTAIAQRVHSITNMDILKDMDFSDRPYANIYRNHYKYGCYRCTKEHERHVPCPEIPGAINIAQPSPINNSSTASQDTFHTLNNSSNNSSNISDNGGLNLLDDLSTPAPAPPLTAPISAQFAAAAAAQAASSSPANVKIVSQGKIIDATLQMRDNRDSSAKRGRTSPEAPATNSSKKARETSTKATSSQGRSNTKKSGK